MQVEWTEKEQAAIADLAKRMDLTATQVLRQALRLYQSVTLGHMQVTPTQPPVGCPELD